MHVTNDVSAAVAAAAATGSPAAGSTSTTPTNSTDGLANEQTFLQLLVAQIQNQDPMSPTDSMQFVTQLAQFSSLEQLININQGISTLNTDLTGSANKTSAASQTTN